MERLSALLQPAPRNEVHLAGAPTAPVENFRIFHPLSRCIEVLFAPLCLHIMSFRDHYARKEEYIPSGPVQNPRVREFATECLAHIKQSEVLHSDKARFLQYMKALTNDILGIDLEPAYSKSPVAPSSGHGSSPTPSSSSIKGPVEPYVPMEISLDMREATSSSLGKMQSLRASLLRNLQKQAAPSGLAEQMPVPGHNGSAPKCAGDNGGQAWASAVSGSVHPPLFVRRCVCVACIRCPMCLCPA